MQLTDLVKSSWQSLVRTRNRSILTMLGIVIGIAAVILSLSIGESAQSFILSQISSFGGNKLIIHTGPRTQLENPSPFAEESLVMKDVKRLLRETWLDGVSGEIMQTDMIKAGSVNKSISVIGTLPDEITISDYRVEDGAFFSMSDVDGHARVAVLGAGIAEEIFGQERAVGKSIKLGTTGFRVVGVMQKLGTQMFTNLDDLAYIPATTLMDTTGKKYFHYLITRADNVPAAEAISRLEIILREQHNLDNPDGDPAKDDFFVMTQADAVKVLDQITGALQVLLSSIAAISLLVGGIGIMNIMFVSVTERIPEIGLRKALGARSRDVLRQFLSEAILLTVGGGVAGIVAGSVFAWLAIQIINSYQPGWVYMVSWTGAFWGVLVSTLIGLVFGYFPARRAARLHPIESLRAE